MGREVRGKEVDGRKEGSEREEDGWRGGVREEKDEKRE